MLVIGMIVHCWIYGDCCWLCFPQQLVSDMMFELICIFSQFVVIKFNVDLGSAKGIRVCDHCLLLLLYLLNVTLTLFACLFCINLILRFINRKPLHFTSAF